LIFRAPTTSGESVRLPLYKNHIEAWSAPIKFEEQNEDGELHNYVCFLRTDGRASISCTLNPAGCA
jgi:hypothetical protein